MSTRTRRVGVQTIIINYSPKVSQSYTRQYHSQQDFDTLLTTRSSGSGAGVLENRLTRLLRQQVNGQLDEEARNHGERTRIHHPQSRGTLDPEPRIQHGPDGRGAARVVAERVGGDVVLDLVLGAGVGPARLGLDEGAVERDEVVHGAAGKGDALVRGLQVLLGGGVAPAKGVEGDGGDVARIGGAQGDGAGRVLRRGLEADPGPVAVVGAEGEVRPAREEAREVGGRAVDDEVRVGAAGRRGPYDDADGLAAGGVDALGGGVEAGEVAVEAGVGDARVAVEEGAAVDEGEVGGGLADDGHLDVVAQVVADGEVGEDGNVEGGELGGGADAAELEELRRVEGARGEDDLARGIDDAGALDGGGGGARVGAVERGALEVGDARGAERVVEVDLGDEGVELDVPGCRKSVSGCCPGGSTCSSSSLRPSLPYPLSPCELACLQVVHAIAILIHGVGDLQDPVPHPVAGRVLHGQRDLVGPRGDGGPGRVDVLEEDLGEPGDGLDQHADEADAHGGGGGDDDADDL